MFWMLKRTVLLRRFCEYPQDLFWLRDKKKKINFQLGTFILRSGFLYENIWSSTRFWRLMSSKEGSGEGPDWPESLPMANTK